MSQWRDGEFDRNRISGIWHPFTPARAVTNLIDIELDQLWNSGKRLLLLDVDNTIVKWGTEEFDEHILGWIEKAHELGFVVCLISNTRKIERLERVKQLLKAESVRGRFKPSRAMFRLAMIKFGHKSHETLMIGDQLMTDILGANRSGIEAIWVRKMEGAEFAGTRINRMFERFFASFVYRALIAPVDEQPSHESEKPIQERTIFHQLFRFAVVGGSSFVIDYSIRMTLMFAVPWDGGRLSEKAGAALQAFWPALFKPTMAHADAFFPVAATIAAIVATLNSFVWNRLWTFEIRGSHQRLAQLRRVFEVALVGSCINVLLSTIFFHILPFDDKWNVRVATVLGAVVASVWNFMGQRMYAFRSRHPSP